MDANATPSCVKKNEHVKLFCLSVYFEEGLTQDFYERVLLMMVVPRHSLLKDFASLASLALYFF